MKIFHF